MLEDLRLRRRYDGFVFLAESVRNPPVIASHHHVELELNLVRRGEISYVLGQRRFTFGPRTLLWLFPAQEHQLVDRSADAENYVVVFKPALIASACHSPDYAALHRRKAAADGVLSTVLPPDRFDLLRGMLDSLLEGAPVAEVLNREVGFGLSKGFRYEHADPDRLNAGLRHLLLLAWRGQQAGGGNSAAVALHPAVARALEQLGDARGELTLAHLARSCGASEAHLSRMFARQIGVPLARYRNSLRLGRFWNHYRGGHTQHTVAESAYAAGFGSYAQFHRVFTQAYGRGPRASLQSRPLDRKPARVRQTGTPRRSDWPARK